MTCPYCPRVFPWASSLQRHMLTHTGNTTTHTHTHYLRHSEAPPRRTLGVQHKKKISPFLPLPGQKPFPCPKCDAFFSTKSNCERHLLRKHGVTARTLRRNGNIVKKDGDDGSPESAGEKAAASAAAAGTPLVAPTGMTPTSDPVTAAESQSETEQITPEKQDPSAARDAGSAQPEEPEAGQGSPAPKPNQGQCQKPQE